MYVNRNTLRRQRSWYGRGQDLYAPFGHTVGNVFHNNAGFGWYVNTAFPMDLVNLGAGLEAWRSNEGLCRGLVKVYAVFGKRRRPQF